MPHCRLLPRGAPVAPGQARRHGRARWAGLLLAGVCGAPLGAGAQASTPPLLLVQPMDHTLVGNVVAQHFARWLPHYLKEPVVLHRPSNGKGLEGIDWAGRLGAPDRTLVLLTPLWLARLEAQPPVASGARDWVPLQMVLQGNWCLLAPGALWLPDFAKLHAWLQALDRPVRLGLPQQFGFPELWMQAMAQKTGLRWQAVDFRSGHRSVQALSTAQVDLVLDRCADVALDTPSERRRMGLQSVQILAQSGPPTPQTQRIPTLAQWKLPPLPGGWLAWFAPATMRLERQAAVAQALHAIVLREDTRALVTAQQQVPVRLDPEGSRRFIQRSQRIGASLRQWLERSADPLQDMDTLVR